MTHVSLDMPVRATDLQEPVTPRVHRAQEAMDGHAHPVQVQPLVGDLGFGAESPGFNQGSTLVVAPVFASVVGLRAKATLERVGRDSCDLTPKTA